MPITETRMVTLLDALGDAMEALDRVATLIADANARAAEGADSRAELTSLALMCDPKLLLQRPVETKLALERERAIWTPARRRANAKRRKPASGLAHDLERLLNKPGDQE